MALTVREYDGDPSHRRSPALDADGSPACRAEYVIERRSSPADPSFLGDPVRGCGGAFRPAPLRQERLSSFSISVPRFGALRLCRRYLVSAPRRIFADLFLPLGYPHSVGESYLSYQIYDSVQGVCSYLRGVVSTSAVLTAAGVGDAEATAMSAAAAWAMRDGLGMVGGLFFSYCASSGFDSHVKEYRLFADVINDVGLTLDMMAPHFGRGRVLYITGVATVCKVMCGMAAGATKGSITHHFAVRGNMADLNAKESTQETLVSLMGMVMGIALARYLHRLERSSCATGASVGDGDGGSTCEQGNVAAVVSWTIFIVLTILHVWANYRGVKLLRLRTLNRERAEMALCGVVRGCLDRCERSMMTSNTSKESGPLLVEQLLDTIPAPNDVNESLWTSTRKLFFPGRIHLGTRIGETFQNTSNEDILYCLAKEFRNEQYVLEVVSSKDKILSPKWRICVSLRSGANELGELKAFLHAMLVSRCIERKLLPTKGGDEKNLASWQRRLVPITHAYVNELFGDADENGDADHSPRRLSLCALSERGWECERLYLGFGPWRIQWEEKID